MYCYFKLACFCLIQENYNFRIFERRSRLLAQIEDVRRTRALQRASRKRHGGSHGEALATVAIVGYTNAVGGQSNLNRFSVCYYQVL